jgi:hypothetical protein
MGIEHILEQHQDRAVMAELDTNVSVPDMVDIVLYDSFAQPESRLRRHRAAGSPATWLEMSAVIDDEESPSGLPRGVQVWSSIGPSCRYQKPPAPMSEVVWG